MLPTCDLPSYTSAQSIAYSRCLAQVPHGARWGKLFTQNRRHEDSPCLMHQIFHQVRSRRFLVYALVHPSAIAIDRFLPSNRRALNMQSRGVVMRTAGSQVQFMDHHQNWYPSMFSDATPPCLPDGLLQAPCLSRGDRNARYSRNSPGLGRYHVNTGTFPGDIFIVFSPLQMTTPYELLAHKCT